MKKGLLANAILGGCLLQRLLCDQQERMNVGTYIVDHLRDKFKTRLNSVCGGEERDSTRMYDNLFC